ncbi:glutamate 5-kinase [Thiothrix eikelboomii]|uniref:Glutamate 5-kinase n=1 Tax=Thiothrix eikelboomii TaxID=92487 RepID=A0A1T4VY00_9GAMM|nr:glutamate 5-kinase [Thiothrix eikelboomii]SKA69797.1 glutamate 5-kinase [Thiothrix eikelboomii]
MQDRAEFIRTTRRWIVKIGSALLTRDGAGLDRAALADWAGQMARLRKQGIEIVLVSSGAVAEGMSRMGWKQKPKALFEKQAAAAIGQMSLIHAYEVNFQEHGYLAAQVLLTHDDLANRRRYLNARNTLRTLVELGTIPVINENDTVAAEEIRLGDNDTLGALVANLVEAELLVILTDQQGLYDKDPRKFTDAQLISSGRANDERFLEFAGGAGTAIGSGGMRTKVLAARRAATSGCATVIASGREANVLERLYAGEDLGSLLLPDQAPLVARKQWIASQLQSRGQLWLDAGAAQAIQRTGGSLLPVGVVKVEGEFGRGEVVSCMSPEGKLLAKGLVNYNSDEAERIKRKPSREIEGILGYIDAPELIHRDNLVLL